MALVLPAIHDSNQKAPSACNFLEWLITIVFVPAPYSVLNFPLNGTVSRYNSSLSANSFECFDHQHPCSLPALDHSSFVLCLSQCLPPPFAGPFALTLVNIGLVWWRKTRTSLYVWLIVRPRLNVCNVWLICINVLWVIRARWADKTCTRWGLVPGTSPRVNGAPVECRLILDNELGEQKLQK